MWPDRREFGVEGMSLEDEFMALREICFTELPSLSFIFVPLICMAHSICCLQVSYHATELSKMPCHLCATKCVAEFSLFCFFIKMLKVNLSYCVCSTQQCPFPETDHSPIANKKVSYCKQIARQLRTDMSTASRPVITLALKLRLGVIEGHCKWHHLMDHIQLIIS